MASGTMKIQVQPLGWGIQLAYVKVMSSFRQRIDENFIWIEEVIAEAKKTLKTDNVELLPKTPSSKRTRRRRSAKTSTGNENISFGTKRMLRSASQSSVSNVSSDSVLPNRNRKQPSFDLDTVDEVGELGSTYENSKTVERISRNEATKDYEESCPSHFTKLVCPGAEIEAGLLSEVADSLTFMPEMMKSKEQDPMEGSRKKKSENSQATMAKKCLVTFETESEKSTFSCSELETEMEQAIKPQKDTNSLDHRENSKAHEGRKTRKKTKFSNNQTVLKDANARGEMAGLLEYSIQAKTLGLSPDNTNNTMLEHSRDSYSCGRVSCETEQGLTFIPEVTEVKQPNTREGTWKNKETEDTGTTVAKKSVLALEAEDEKTTQKHSESAVETENAIKLLKDRDSVDKNQNGKAPEGRMTRKKTKYSNSQKTALNDATKRDEMAGLQEYSNQAKVLVLSQDNSNDTTCEMLEQSNDSNSYSRFSGEAKAKDEQFERKPNRNESARDVSKIVSSSVHSQEIIEDMMDDSVLVAEQVPTNHLMPADSLEHGKTSYLPIETEKDEIGPSSDALIRKSFETVSLKLDAKSIVQVTSKEINSTDCFPESDKIPQENQITDGSVCDSMPNNFDAVVVSSAIGEGCSNIDTVSLSPAFCEGSSNIETVSSAIDEGSFNIETVADSIKSVPPLCSSFITWEPVSSLSCGAEVVSNVHTKFCSDKLLSKEFPDRPELKRGIFPNRSLKTNYMKQTHLTSSPSLTKPASTARVSPSRIFLKMSGQDMSPVAGIFPMLNNGDLMLRSEHKVKGMANAESCQAASPTNKATDCPSVASQNTAKLLRNEPKFFPSLGSPKSPRTPECNNETSSPVKRFFSKMKVKLETFLTTHKSPTSPAGGIPYLDTNGLDDDKINVCPVDNATLVDEVFSMEVETSPVKFCSQEDTLQGGSAQNDDDVDLHGFGSTTEKRPTRSKKSHSRLSSVRTRSSIMHRRSSAFGVKATPHASRKSRLTKKFVSALKRKMSRTASTIATPRKDSSSDENSPHLSEDATPISSIQHNKHKVQQVQEPVATVGNSEQINDTCTGMASVPMECNEDVMSDDEVVCDTPPAASLKTKVLVQATSKLMPKDGISNKSQMLVPSYEAPIDDNIPATSNQLPQTPSAKAKRPIGTRIKMITEMLYQSPAFSSKNKEKKRKSNISNISKEKRRKSNVSSLASQGKPGSKKQAPAAQRRVSQMRVLRKKPSKGISQWTDLNESRMSNGSLTSTGSAIKATGSAVKKELHPASFLNMLSKKPSSNLITSTSVKSFIPHMTPVKITREEQEEIKRKDLEAKKKKLDEAEQRKQEQRIKKAEELKRQREERQRLVLQRRQEREQKELEMKREFMLKMEEAAVASNRAMEERLKEEREKQKFRDKKMAEAEQRRKQEEDIRQQMALQQGREREGIDEQQRQRHETDERVRKLKIAEQWRQNEERRKQVERERLAEQNRLRLLEEQKFKEEQQLKEEQERKEKAERRRLEVERQREIEIMKQKEMKQLEEENKLRETNGQKLQDKTACVNTNTVHGTYNVAGKMASNTTNSDSYEISPVKKVKKPPSSENYNINDLNSDDSTDDESRPRKHIPQWAQGIPLKTALITQFTHPPDVDKIFGPIYAPDLNEVFDKAKPRFNKRTSSAVWDKPLLPKPSSLHI